MSCGEWGREGGWDRRHGCLNGPIPSSGYESAARHSPRLSTRLQSSMESRKDFYCTPHNNPPSSTPTRIRLSHISSVNQSHSIQGLFNFQRFPLEALPPPEPPAPPVPDSWKEGGLGGKYYIPPFHSRHLPVPIQHVSLSISHFLTHSPRIICRPFIAPRSRHRLHRATYPRASGENLKAKAPENGIKQAVQLQAPPASAGVLRHDLFE